MVQRSHGFRVNTRYKLKKRRRERGLTPITHSMWTFEEGQKVVIYIDPSIHAGMPHPRFHGRAGIVRGKQGRVFKVEIKDGGKKKILLSGPEHLKAVESKEDA